MTNKIMTSEQVKQLNLDIAKIVFNAAEEKITSPKQIWKTYRNECEYNMAKIMEMTDYEEIDFGENPTEEDYAEFVKEYWRGFLVSFGSTIYESSFSWKSKIAELMLGAEKDLNYYHRKHFCESLVKSCKSLQKEKNAADHVEFFSQKLKQSLASEQSVAS